MNEDSGSFRGRRRRLSFWLAMATVIVCIWASFAWLVTSERTRALADEAAKNTNLVDAHADGKNHELRQLDQTLLALRYEYARFGQPETINGFLAASSVDRSFVETVSLIGSDGEIIASTGPALKSKVSDQDYFLVHTHEKGDSLFVGAPIKSRLTGHTVISLTRKLTDDEGGFAGIVLMSVNPDYFAADYRDHKLDADANIAMIGLDGITRVSRIGTSITHGEVIKASSLFAALKSSPSGSYIGVTASDGVQRTASFRKLDDYDLVIVIASAMSDIDKSLRIRDFAYFIVALLLSAAVILGSVAAAGFRRTKATAAVVQATLEDQLRQSQKMEAIGSLASGIAHDFNNILGSILGNADLAIHESEKNPLALESLYEIRNAGTKGRELVQQILTFSRKTPKVMQPVNVSECVKDVIRMLRSTIPTQIELEHQIHDESATVLADPIQLEQVLINLITNAAHALSGRCGVISTSVDTVDDVLGRHLNEGEGKPVGCVRIEVRDNGIGMSAATLNRIFEPFFTTKPRGEGTGLGLSLVHGLVHSFGGRINVTSELGAGTLFTLHFPQTEKAKLMPKQEDDESPVAVPFGNGQRIMYVDDDESIVFLAIRMLRRNGYRALGFENCTEALTALKADPMGFALLVTDFNMPGMSGLELAVEARKISKSIPIAMASGFITDELLAQAKKVGIQKVISKSGLVEDFCQTVGHILAI